jgi:Lrp/AsnC family leucine-responsive transcriptional regulator
MNASTAESRKLDSYDRRILATIQRRGDIGPTELSEIVHLSMSQCSRRLQRLKAEGYVAVTASLLSEAHLHIGVKVFVVANLRSHETAHTTAFHERIRSNPQISECHKVTGESDYLLKICTKDLATFNEVLNGLLSAPEIAHVRSSIVLESLKSTTELPLDFA